MLEILVVFVVVAILAAIGLVAIRNVKSRSRAGATISQINAFQKALWTYCQNAGRYPPETAAGVDPGLRTNVHNEASWRGPYISKSDFNMATTPMGGRWDWVNSTQEGSPPPGTPSYGLAVLNDPGGQSPLDMRAGEIVDKLLDDGNPNTGKWTKGRWTSEFMYEIDDREECEPGGG